MTDTRMITSGKASLIWTLGLLLAPSTMALAQDGPFQRISTFPVFLNTDIGTQTVSEIVAAAEGGNVLVYTDSANGNVGFVDITDPAQPVAAGVVPMGGEPTSVAVSGAYALVCVDTSIDFVNTSGDLQVIDVATRQIVRSIPLGGQPDAIDVSPDGQFAAIAIENERDEDLGNGEPPQQPAGFVVIVDLLGQPADWSTRQVDLVGVPDLFPEDPEPEYIDINVANVAVVTLQENNHIVLIYLPTGEILLEFPAGTVDLTDVDTSENDLIETSATLQAVPREPDAVAWTSPFSFATADEGDLFGGSRGFTIFTPFGNTLYEAGNSVEQAVTRIGHYPEGRSENKGNEPESVVYANFAGSSYLFVGSERSSVVLVYELLSPFAAPVLRQILPTSVAPEGLLAIPERDLFVVACEEDSREDIIRASIMVYARTGQSSYPTIVSADRTGTSQPIPWAALSGLASDPADASTVYTVYDSFYRESRLFTMDVSQEPAVITHELALVDSGNVLLDSLNDLKAQLPGTDDFVPASLINANGTVNLDPEGVTIGRVGTRWIVSEGSGNLVNGVSDPGDRPFESPNLILQVGANGSILRAIAPPLEVTRNQLRFGFEGVATAGNFLFVAFQRAWQDAGDPADRARIGRYDLVNGTWAFAHYPLDAATSPQGGWVGLSEIVFLGQRRFAVLERDNQGGPDGRVKRVYSFSIAGIEFKDAAQVAVFDLLQKDLEYDVILAGAYEPTAGPLPEKLEGMAVLADGTLLIVNDNDGVDDNSGETLLLRLPGVFD